MGTYLVTGVAGFIGSKVASLLLGDGHTVVGVDNLNDSCDPLLKQWRLDQLAIFGGFTFYKLDICDLDRLDAEIFGPYNFDAVFNLAARAGVRQSVVDPWIYYRSNVTGTLTLLELCRTHDVQKFVLASSSSLYGAGKDLPYREDHNTDNTLSPYAASKKAAEALCYTYHHLHGIDITVFRYFTVYGPAGRPDMSPFRFVQWINEQHPVTVYGDGQQSRDFTYVEDIARGTIAGLEPVGYEVINLGSDTPIVLMEMIRQIEAKAGHRARLEFHPPHRSDVEATWADISKAERLLGWRPQVTFEEGIERLVSWYQTNRDWTSIIETGIPQRVST